jgi:hypothetical protein
VVAAGGGVVNFVEQVARGVAVVEGADDADQTLFFVAGAAFSEAGDASDAAQAVVGQAASEVFRA